MRITVSNVEDVIGVVTMNHGKVNALSKVLLDDITTAFDHFQSSPVRVIILRAIPGARVFSAGHGVKELPTYGPDPLTYDDPLRRVVRTIQHTSQPVIAMIEGSVWGGPCELVMGCDLIVAAEDSTFAFTSAKLGVPYDIQGTLNFLKSAGNYLLKELLFSAEPVCVRRLEMNGAVNRVVPASAIGL